MAAVEDTVPTRTVARTRTARTTHNQFVSHCHARHVRNLLTDRSQHQQQPATRLNPPELPHQHSTYSQATQDSSYSQQAGEAYTTSANAPPLPSDPKGHVEYVQPSSNNLSNPDFLSRVEAVKADIRTLTTHVGQIATLHQQSISSADNAGASNALESMVTQTQVLNTSIKDQIKYLETDAARSQGNTVKDTQIRQLKTSFTKQLQEYRQEEANYERRYREQIARQYRIVNPEATEAEVQEAMGADWANEGVFQTAVSLPKKCPRSKTTKTDSNPSSKPTAPQPPTPSSATSAHATTTSKRSSAR
jgi:syntaxin 1B/2/3